MLRSALLFLAAAMPLAARQPLTETIEVRVVNIDVVVTDASGKRVTGLSRDDFQLLEDGVPQRITNLYEIRDGEPQAAQGETGAVPAEVPRRFVFFIDNDSIHPSHRKRITSSLERFVDVQMEPGDLAAVVSWDRSLRVVAPLTSDRQLLRAAIRTVAAGGSGKSLKTQSSRVQNECVRILENARVAGIRPFIAYQECVNVVKGEMQATTLISRQLLNAVELTLTTIAGTEGRKVLVLAGALLPKNPGEELFQWANHLFMPIMTGFDAPNQQPDQDDEQTAFLERVARAANAHGVTLYTIAATVSERLDGPEYNHAIEDRGADFLNQANTYDAHAVLTRMTGGLSFNRPVDFDAAFATIARDSRSYYSIGYRPPTTIGGDRAVSVRTKHSALVVRARQSHAMKTADEMMSDRVVANIFVPAPPSSWPASVTTGKPVKEGTLFKVPFEISASPEITLLPADGGLTGRYMVYVAVGTAQGALSTVFRQPDSIAIEADDEAQFRQVPLTFAATLTVRPGENILSVGLVDQIGGTTTFARTTIMAR